MIWAFGIACAFAATFIWWWRRVERVVLTALERRTSIPEAPVSTVSAPKPMPSDLVSYAMKESEGWARESALKAMHELFDVTQDWDVVRGTFAGTRK